MTARALSFLVTGRVQGVGMRWSTQRRAQELELVGWVRNLPNGKVEGLVQGDASAVEQFLDWLAEGPSWARIDHLVTEAVPVDPRHNDFLIR